MEQQENNSVGTVKYSSIAKAGLFIVKKKTLLSVLPFYQPNR